MLIKYTCSFDLPEQAIISDGWDYLLIIIIIIKVKI